MVEYPAFNRQVVGSSPIGGTMKTVPFLPYLYRLSGNYYDKLDWVRTRLFNIQQDPVYHPEGNAWIHTVHVVAAMERICSRENLSEQSSLTLMVAALLHDIGKSVTTVYDGGWKSPGHAEAGVPLAQEFLDKYDLSYMASGVIPLVAEHMVHLNDVNFRTVKRLKLRLGAATITELIYLIEADYAGRPPNKPYLPYKAQKILELSNLIVEKPVPIIMGRHLIQLGLSPSPEFSKILSKCLEAQIAGIFSNESEAYEYLSQYIDSWKINS